MQTRRKPGPLTKIHFAGSNEGTPTSSFVDNPGLSLRNAQSLGGGPKRSLYTINMKSAAQLPPLRTVAVPEGGKSAQNSFVDQERRRMAKKGWEGKNGSANASGVEETKKSPKRTVGQKAAEVSPAKPKEELLGFESRVKDFACRTFKGRSPNKPDKKNQDSHFIIKDFVNAKEVYLFGILDGHGMYGHLVSDFVRKRLPLNIELAELKTLQAVGNVRTPAGQPLSRSFISAKPRGRLQRTSGLPPVKEPDAEKGDLAGSVQEVERRPGRKQHRHHVFGHHRCLRSDCG